MKTIRVVEAFSGYPAGAHEGSKRRDFEKGAEVEVPNDFADLIVEKGHAKLVEAKPEPKAKAKSTDGVEGSAA